MAYDLEKPAETAEGGGRWLRAAGWPLVVLVGWLLFELTAQPALVVIALCLKFGWNDARTAAWLWRKDPGRGRAWACFFLYLSSGMWKVTLGGVLVLIVLIFALTIASIAVGPQAQPGVAVEDQLIAAALMGGLGSALAVPLTGAAVLLALLSRARLWLNGGARQARRADRWPPPDGLCGQVNRTGLLTLTALILTWLTALGATIAVLTSLQRGGGNRQLFAMLFPVVMVLGWGAGIFVIYKLQNLFERSVFAASPGDCWGRAAAEGHARADAADAPLDVSV